MTGTPVYSSENLFENFGTLENLFEIYGAPVAVVIISSPISFARGVYVRDLEILYICYMYEIWKAYIRDIEVLHICTRYRSLIYMYTCMRCRSLIYEK